MLIQTVSACWQCQKAHEGCDDYTHWLDPLLLQASRSSFRRPGRPCIKCTERGIAGACAKGHLKKTRDSRDMEKDSASLPISYSRRGADGGCQVALVNPTKRQRHANMVQQKLGSVMTSSFHFEVDSNLPPAFVSNSAARSIVRNQAGSGGSTDCFPPLQPGDEQDIAVAATPAMDCESGEKYC